MIVEQQRQGFVGRRRAADAARTVASLHDAHGRGARVGQERDRRGCGTAAYSTGQAPRDAIGSAAPAANDHADAGRAVGKDTGHETARCEKAAQGGSTGVAGSNAGPSGGCQVAPVPHPAPERERVAEAPHGLFAAQLMRWVETTDTNASIELRKDLTEHGWERHEELLEAYP